MTPQVGQVASRTPQTVGDPRELAHLLAAWLERQGLSSDCDVSPSSGCAGGRRPCRAWLIDVAIRSLHDLEEDATDEAGAALRVVVRPDAVDAIELQPSWPRRVVRVGDVRLDTATRTVRRGGVLVEVTGIEFEVLTILLDRAGQVVSRDDLSRLALGRHCQPADRSVDVHVSKLRRKLGPRGGSRITAVRGVGYVYIAADD